MITTRTQSPEETLALGRRLAGVLLPGDVVLLDGRLGTGKTLLTSGIAQGLGIAGPVSSPTFVIARVYRDGLLPLVHADVYRLGSMLEFEDLDLEETAANGVLVIEWGEAVEGSVSADRLVVEIEIAGETERVVRFIPCGSWQDRSLEGVV
ncbi:MAG TPA: tRNA (adenosine(37)-N6)-threonylcarbamoyltransferase complex ATPase subunit type 1 TsaE [Acidimicrobiia bacterium]|nr:tRNA (adenosine(37)-N6)-threonylcarbamoyltransferase complex ATPase subunit type 1 TsaE [Acidimicrobiia bacterium]